MESDTACKLTTPVIAGGSEVGICATELSTVIVTENWLLLLEFATMFDVDAVTAMPLGSPLLICTVNTLVESERLRS